MSHSARIMDPMNPTKSKIELRDARQRARKVLKVRIPLHLRRRNLIICRLYWENGQSRTRKCRIDVSVLLHSMTTYVSTDTAGERHWITFILERFVMIPTVCSLALLLSGE